MVCEPLPHPLNDHLLVFYSDTDYLLTPDIDLDYVALGGIIFTTPCVSGTINNVVPTMLVNYCLVLFNKEGLSCAIVFKI